MAREYICPACHTIARPKYRRRGSGKVELYGWLMFPLGVPYTLWRMFSKIPICKSCGGETLIDIHSAVGERLMEQFDKGLFTPKPFETSLSQKQKKPDHYL